MKRAIALILVIASVLWGTAVAADITSQINYSALEWYAQAVTEAFRIANYPLTMSASEYEGAYSLTANYISEYSTTATIEDALTSEELPVNLMVSYSSYNNSIIFVFGQKTVTETPTAVEIYADGQRLQGEVLVAPEGADPATSICGFHFSLDAVQKVMNASDAFMRLQTDKGTSFIEVSGENMLLPYCMLGLVCSGAEYSWKDSPYYLDKTQLWDEIRDWQPQEKAAVQTVAPTAKSFQTDYEAIDKAAQSAFLLEVYDYKDQLIATGSGFIAFDKGTLITNEHVIEDAAYVIAYSDQYRNQYKLTELKAVDKEADIAILNFDENANVQPLSVDCNAKLLRGQPVTAIGSPKGILNTVSSGNISNIVYYSETIPDYIQFTAPISPGSSGGALFNEQGKVIGLCVSYLKEAEAMYYAIPIKYVEEMYKAAKGKTTTTLLSYNVPNFAAPKLTTVENGINVQWEAVPGATRYSIYRRLANSHEEFELYVRSKTTSVLDPTAQRGKTYEYRIDAEIGSTTVTSGVAKIARPTPTLKPKATSTPKPTATPNTSVQINTTVKASRGNYTISWTGGTAPYRITWKPADGKGESFSNSGIRSKSYTTACMIPGCRYAVTITDAKNKTVTKTVSVPTASTFRDGSLTSGKIGIQLSPRRDADGNQRSSSPVYVQTLYADDMLAGIKKGATYGLYYRIDLPSFSGERTWMQTIVFRAPNGYRYIWYADYDSYTFPGSESWWKWDCMGQAFFQELYDTYHRVLTGQYYIDLYWDGMLVKSAGFQVK